MSFSLHARKAFIWCSLVLGVPGYVSATGSYLTNGSEYRIAGPKAGDQVHPSLALGADGGFLVWEDNATSSSGLAINALRLDNNFSASLSSFKVNSSNTGDHERAQVALLNNGGAAFVWQGGKFGFQHIYARFLSSSNTWLTDDIQVNSSSSYYQLSPAVTMLKDGNVAVVWSSMNQAGAGSMQDVYGQLFTPEGQKVGDEFMVNQFTSYNQRTPVLAALSTGGFVVAWVSEQQRIVGLATPQLAFPVQLQVPSVDVFARTFSNSGQPLSNEFLVNTGSNVCANPSIAAGSDGGFMVAWGQMDPTAPQIGWDVFGRIYSSGGSGGAVNRLNTETYGPQVGPHLATAGAGFLAVWTSMGQDSSMDGIFGQFLNADGSMSGGEFRVNTTWVNKQMHPAVASDSTGRVVVGWTGFTGGSTTFDLFAQRYVSASEPLDPMSAPFVFVPFITSNGAYEPEIVVSWPVQNGLPVDHYNVYVDGTLANSPVTNTWTMTAANGLAASTTHSFQVAAVASDGRTTPLSPATSATTWGGFNWGGIPFEWMAQYYGADASKWPPANNTLPDGNQTLYQIFLTGANPQNASTWLRTSMEVTYVQGQPVYLLHWNTQPGLTYQVQTSTDMNHWEDYQPPRMAADVVDSMAVPKNNVQYYRLVRLR